MQSPTIAEMLKRLIVVKPAILNEGLSAIMEGAEAEFSAASSWILVTHRDVKAPIGWTPITLFATDHSSGWRKNVEMWFNERELDDCVGTRYLLAGAGSLRAVRPRALMSATEWENSFVKKEFEALGMVDRLIGVMPVGEFTEIHLGIERKAPGQSFTADDERHLEEFLSVIERFCQWLALSFGVVQGQGPFTRREREVLTHLLTEASEKQIASELCLASGSVHQIVVRVFRKLQVTSRVELMALWLQGGPKNVSVAKAPLVYP